MSDDIFFTKYPKIPHWDTWYHEWLRKKEEYLRECIWPPSIKTVVVTEKIHGTNCGVRIFKDGKILTQSRNRIITPKNDNYGFSSWAHTVPWMKVLRQNHYEWGKNDSVMIFGEWCGQGIQRGVGIAESPRLYYVFGITDNDMLQFREGLIIHMPEYNIYPETYLGWNKKGVNLMIDGKAEEFVQWVNRIVESVENDSVFARLRGYPGIGEGVIVTVTMTGGAQYKIKFKGEKHKRRLSKKYLKPKEPVSEEVQKWIESTITEERLQQGCDYLIEMGKPIGRESTGDFLKWLVKDVFTEEEHAIVNLDCDAKQIRVLISNIGRKWYFEKLIEAE